MGCSDAYVAATDNRAPDYLADFTGLTIEYVNTVLSFMDELEMWDSEYFRRLITRLDEWRYDLLLGERFLFSALDEVWAEAPLISIDVQQYILRRGIAPRRTGCRPSSRAKWYELWYMPFFG